MANTLFCPYCAAQLKPGNKFCPKCGQNVEHVSSQASGNQHYQQPQYQAPPQQAVPAVPVQGSLQKQISFLENWKRGVAYLIDNLIISVILIIIYGFQEFDVLSMASYTPFYVYMVIFFVYCFVMTLFGQHATVGQIMYNLKVINRETYKGPGLASAFILSIIKAIPPALVLDVILGMLSERRQGELRLSNKLTNTVVAKVL